MRRLRLTTGPAAIFGAVFVGSLVLLLPMRLALGWFGLGDLGFSARAAGGSVWWGSLSEAHVGDVALGDVSAGVSPFALLVGQARVRVDGRDDMGVKPLHGAIGISRHGVGLDDVTASLPTGSAFAPLPVSALDLDGVTVKFEDGSCTRADGRVRATLSGDIGGLALAQGLSGTARCDAGALLLPLTSQSGAEGIALRLWSTGRYRAELSVQPSDPAAIAKLTATGFQQTEKGYILTVEGNF